MPKLLVVGDVHAVADELWDCEALGELIVNSARTKAVDGVVFLGDQTHNHAILNVYVLDFWKRLFGRISGVCPVYVLVGNHDLPGITNNTSINSMSFFATDKVHVVDRALSLGDFQFIGYQAHEADFTNLLSPTAKVVFCHQTFVGSKYENGFFAPDGFAVPNSRQTFVVGHIHSPQSIGHNVVYVGSPRWRSLSDVGVSTRVLTIVDETGILETIPTNDTCMAWRAFEVTPEFDWSTVVGNCRNHATLKGPQLWIDSKIDKASSVFDSVKTVPTDAKSIAVKESAGIAESINKYIDESVTKTPKSTLKELVQKRIWTTQS